MNYFELYEQKRKARASLKPGSVWEVVENGPLIGGEKVTVISVSNSEIVYYYNSNVLGGDRSKQIEVFLEYCKPL